MLNKEPTEYKECSVPITFEGEVSIKDGVVLCKKGFVTFYEAKTISGVLCANGFKDTCFCK